MLNSNAAPSQKSDPIMANRADKNWNMQDDDGGCQYHEHQHKFPCNKTSTKSNNWSHAASAPDAVVTAIAKEHA